MTDVETGACSYFLILLEDTYASWLTLLCRCVGVNRLAKLGGKLELDAPHMPVAEHIGYRAPT